MAEASPERPPSEQGIEYQLLDALGDVRARLEGLERRAPALVASNWWDVLPEEARQPLANPGHVQVFQLLTSYMSAYPILKVSQMPDRIELSLQINGNRIVWQRALFFPGAAPAPARM